MRLMTRVCAGFKRLPLVVQIPLIVFGVLLAVGAVGAAANDQPADGPVVTEPETSGVRPSTAVLNTTSTAPVTTSTSTTSTSTTSTTSVAVTTVAPVSRSALSQPGTAPLTTSPPEPASTVPATTEAPTGRCHPSYIDACVPVGVSDVDCGGGGGNGPAYVYEKNFHVVGPDVYGLDRDGDGIACES